MILIITCVFPPEQIVSANLSRDIANKLVDLGNEVTVLSPKPSRPFGRHFEEQKIEFKGVDHYQADSYIHPKSSFIGRLRESISFGLASKRFIEENSAKIEKIYANTWPIFAQYLTVKTAKKFSIPVIMHVQDVYPESYIKKASKIVGKVISKTIMPFENYVMKNSSRVIAISNGMKDYLVSTRPLSQQHVSVVRNWQDDDFLSKSISNSEGTRDFTFMYAGSVSSSAGVDLLIKAFGDLGTKNDCRLIIAGSGSDKEACMKLAQNNNKIEFWDAPYEQIPEIQAQANVLLLSLKKGVGKTATPSKFIAYLFSKKPVLASIDEDCDTANSIYEANCGFVVPPEDELALRNEMEKILKIELNELIKMGKNGYSYAQQNLSRKANLKNITEILTQ
ncbi:glycosyltransferase family 4 protein [Croceivirga thetidis]|uniref:Glycosyltransferase family 4 protein n=1 Tax=Croceivirga thetidis TaxID=2721623 RepID=A0ABX1GQ17_9FLAO|nr:glycosyltransferase family 4 protein [Croceivirga thetidis]NKI32011.1 glycosyltransferase family 4 protein [Croceivirga thetidis]